MAREMACVYYDNQKCKKFEEPGYVSWCVLGPCSHQVPSRADKIRAMSDEELAKFICQRCDCVEGNCPGVTLCRFDSGTANGMLAWLKQPYEEEL